MVTNPNPLDLPVSLSVGMWHSNTLSRPYNLAKKSNSSAGSVEYDRFPMWSLIAGGRDPFLFLRLPPLLLLLWVDVCLEELCGALVEEF